MPVPRQVLGQKDCCIAHAEVRSRPSKEEKGKTKEQFEVLSNPCCIAKRVFRRVQSMDDPKNSAITLERLNQRDMRKRKDMIPLRSGSKATNCTESLSTPLDGPQKIVNIWIRSRQLVSHTPLRGKSVSDMRTITLSTSMVKGRNLDQRRKWADFPQAINKLLVLEDQVGIPTATS